jgi:TonB family protein
MKTAIWKGLTLVSLLISPVALPTMQTSNVNNPCPIHLESLDYPKIARAARVSGEVVVRLKINANGDVESVETLSGAPILAEEAVRNARKWAFEPGKPTSIEVTYEFRLEDPQTEEEVNPIVVFELPKHVLIISRQRETILN